MSKKEEEYLAPLPPRPASKEGQIDVSTTPAFKCLNEVSVFAHIKLNHDIMYFHTITHQ